MVTTLMRMLAGLQTDPTDGPGDDGALHEPEVVWEQGSGWLHDLGTVGPWVLALVALLVVARAVATRRRHQAVGVLSDAEVEAVHDAIRRVEERTVGEVVPVVVERSDPHPGAPWVAACVTLLLGSALLVVQLPWGDPLLLLLWQGALGAVGYLTALALPGVRRLFVRADRLEAVCQEQAFQEFYRLGLQKTEAATGVLVFVSLLEHRVIVLGDEGIDAVVEPGAWDQVTDAALGPIAGGRLADGLVAAVEAAGEVLAEHFPWTEGDRNELPDRLELRRE